uniref:Uncharacterized protein n=1 Tax=Nelumbo nucifera TaxID=4432 RepID=A0A822YIU3_NELNU|nr:TPA_asm: hypothetical protein HUJ06_010894 [Nelumbo nucifera]
MHLGNVVTKMRRLPGLVWKKIWTVGREDPRRIIHSLKVGFTLTLVSLLYLMEPLFQGIGQNAIWAVMAVVVVLEFTIAIFIAFAVFLIGTTFISICLILQKEILILEFCLEKIYSDFHLFNAGSLSELLTFTPSHNLSKLGEEFELVQVLQLHT